MHSVGPCLNFKSCSRSAVWRWIAEGPIFTIYWDLEGNGMDIFVQISIWFATSLSIQGLCCWVEWKCLLQERCVVHAIGSSTDYRKIGSVSIVHFFSNTNLKFVFVHNSKFKLKYFDAGWERFLFYWKGAHWIFKTEVSAFDRTW